MKLNSLTPNLMVVDVHQTIEYYEDVLGFTVLKTMPETGSDLDWAMVKRNDVILMFQSSSSLRNEIPKLAGAKPGGGLTLYIKVNDIDNLYQSFKDNEVEIISGIEDTFYETTEFSIIDINGYVIVFSEETN